MNREILFRIPYFNKDGSFSHFGYWGTIDHKGEPSLDHGCFTSPGSNGLTKGWHEQFTGLHDKNKKKIFEGDRFGLNGQAIGIVYYDVDNACFCVEDDDDEEYAKVLSGYTGYEIIGTIHDK